MSIHTTSTPTMSGAPRRFGRHAFVAVGGTVLLAGLVTAGVWVDRRGDSPSATVPAPALVAPVVSGASLSHATGATARGHTVYIVGSEEQAATVMTGINDANAILAANNEPPFLDSVLVLPSDVPATEMMNAVTEGNRILFSLGLAEDTVVDLRGN